jgi:hypothetical protein
MAGFIQIIEFKSSRADEIKALGEKYRAERMSDGTGGPVRAFFTEDRDRPGTYLNVVEFESYEKAMENSNDPRTTDFAKKMSELCDGPPSFYNLDIKDSWEG